MCCGFLSEEGEGDLCVVAAWVAVTTAWRRGCAVGLDVHRASGREGGDVKSADDTEGAAKAGTRREFIAGWDGGRSGKRSEVAVGRWAVAVGDDERERRVSKEYCCGQACWPGGCKARVAG